MFHKVKSVNPLPDFRIGVQFAEGVTKEYDVKPLFERLKPFEALAKSPELFSCVEVDTGGYGIGLSIAKSIVEAHKGKISATTSDGSQITMTAVLPS